MELDFDFALILVSATALSLIAWLAVRLLAPSSALTKKGGVVETIASLFPVLLAVLVIRSFLVEPFQIPSGSMRPTLKVGDFILVNKFTYGIRLPVVNTKIIPMNEPKRGDVVVFKYPLDPGIHYIKRLIGLPGDKVTYRDKVLYVNGVEQPQTLLAELPLGPEPKLLLDEALIDGPTHSIYRQPQVLAQDDEWIVPENSYFMVGDNRDASSDSRIWRFVSDDLIVGKAFAVWMHWPHITDIPSFSSARLIN